MYLKIRFHFKKTGLKTHRNWYFLRSWNTGGTGNVNLSGAHYDNRGVLSEVKLQVLQFVLLPLSAVYIRSVLYFFYFQCL